MPLSVPLAPRPELARLHPAASCPPVMIVCDAPRTPSSQRMSYRSCHAFHMPAARAIDAARVARCPEVDLRAVLANARRGLDAALADRAEVERHLPRVPMGVMLSVADVARALVVARGDDERDRLWTLLRERYEHVRRVGWYFHGAGCDAVVPPLEAPSAQAADEDDGVGRAYRARRRGRGRRVTTRGARRRRRRARRGRARGGTPAPPRRAGARRR